MSKAKKSLFVLFAAVLAAALVMGLAPYAARAAEGDTLGFVRGSTMSGEITTEIAVGAPAEGAYTVNNANPSQAPYVLLNVNGAWTTEYRYLVMDFTLDSEMTISVYLVQGSAKENNGKIAYEAGQNQLVIDLAAFSKLQFTDAAPLTAIRLYLDHGIAAGTPKTCTIASLCVSKTAPETPAPSLKIGKLKGASGLTVAYEGEEARVTSTPTGAARSLTAAVTDWTAEDSRLEIEFTPFAGQQLGVYAHDGTANHVIYPYTNYASALRQKLVIPLDGLTALKELRLYDRTPATVTGEQVFAVHSVKIMSGAPSVGVSEFYADTPLTAKHGDDAYINKTNPFLTVTYPDAPTGTPRVVVPVQNYSNAYDVLALRVVPRPGMKLGVYAEDANAGASNGVHLRNMWTDADSIFPADGRAGREYVLFYTLAAEKFPSDTLNISFYCDPDTGGSYTKNTGETACVIKSMAFLKSSELASAEITAQDKTVEYDRSPQEITSSVPAGVEAVYEYKKRGEEGAAWSFTPPSAAGVYDVRVASAYSELFYPSEAAAVLTIEKAASLAPPAASEFTVNYFDKTVSFGAGIEANAQEDFAGEAFASGGSVTPGQTLYVRYAASENNETGLVGTFTVPAVPAAPEITIDYFAEQTAAVSASVEYSADGEHWTQGAGQPLAIVPGNTYYFRVKASETSFEGAVQTLTAPARAAAPEVSVNFAAEKTSAISADLEYAVNGGTWTAGTGAAIDARPGEQLAFRFRAAENAFAGETQQFTLPARPAAPQLTIDYASGTTNEEVPATVEYSTDGGVTWTAGTGGKVTLAQECTYLFRVKATDTAFSGTPLELAADKPAAPLFTVDYAAEKTVESVGTDVEYSTDGGATWTDGGGARLTLTAGTTYQFRVKAAAGVPAGLVQTIVIPARAAAPEFAVNFADEATTGAVPAGIEWSTDRERWTDGAGAALALTPGETYYFRVKAGADSYAGSVQTLAVAARPGEPGIECNYYTGATSAPLPETVAYSTDGGETWRTGLNAPISLHPGKTYVFRIVGTQTSFTGESQTLTLPAREAAPNYTVDYAAGTTKELGSGCEYSVDGGATWAVASGKIALTPGESYWIRKAASADAFASEIQVLYVPSRAAAPVFTVDLKSCKTAEEVPAYIEYSTNGTDWTAGTGVRIALTPGAAYTFRVRAGEASFAGEACTLTAPPRAAAPQAEAVEVTTDKVVLAAVEGAEYRIEGGVWQDSPEFSGLAAGTEYRFYVRAKATDTEAASEEVAVSAATQAPAGGCGCGTVAAAGPGAGGALAAIGITLAGVLAMALASRRRAR